MSATYFKVDSKTISDGNFTTEYTWYYCLEHEKHVFVFGDSDIYQPEDGYYDWECDSYEEAYDWFMYYDTEEGKWLST